jgi:hypothetical protein
MFLWHAIKRAQTDSQMFQKEQIVTWRFYQYTYTHVDRLLISPNFPIYLSQKTKSHPWLLSPISFKTPTMFKLL